MKDKLQTRRRVVFVVVSLLLILDIARSINARFAYEKPHEIWQPNQAVYADLTWPPGADLPPDTPLGRRIYAQRCAVCHGPDGRGNGPAAPSMIPHPRDFTMGQFKYKSTIVGHPPSDADLTRVIKNGLQASAMPYWHDLLSEEEVQAVVELIKGLSPVFDGPIPETLTVPPRATPDADSLTRGQDLYVKKACVACHGPEGRGGITLKDAKGYTVIARDLTAPWTFRGGSDPEQLWLRLTTGMAPSPMFSFEKITTPEERWDLVNYVLSLARVPPWESGGKLDGPGQDTDRAKRGAYLVHAEMCGLCHTQVNKTGIYRSDDFHLAGGMRVAAYPQGIFVTRNLTSDPETGLGKWSVSEIAKAIRTGRTPTRMLNFWGMPWMYLHNLTEEDALSIATYLKTRTPVYNKIPAPLKFGFLETTFVKLSRLPQANPKTLSYGDGNFGLSEKGKSIFHLQPFLIGGQWVVLFVGVVAFFFAGPSGRRLPKGGKGWSKTILGCIGVFLISLIGAGLYHFPALRIIPAEQVGLAINAEIPEPDVSAFKTEEERRLVERGRYLFTVASCPFCHQNDGRGGMKISMKSAFGTLWTRNITSDKITGIGNWSDQEIRRAIRSGVTPNGRTLHWQGMNWDHASNWSEEDLRALTAYLRTLPPVENEIPATRAPAEDDCEVYTFWVTESDVNGCG